MQNIAVSQFGITHLSPPDTARVLARSPIAVEKLIADGLLTVVGRTKRLIPLAQVERLRARPVSIEEYFQAIQGRRHNPQTPTASAPEVSTLDKATKSRTETYEKPAENH